LKPKKDKTSVPGSPKVSLSSTTIELADIALAAMKKATLRIGGAGSDGRKEMKICL